MPRRRSKLLSALFGCLLTAHEGERSSNAQQQKEGGVEAPSSGAHGVQLGHAQQGASSMRPHDRGAPRSPAAVGMASLSVPATPPRSAGGVQQQGAVGAGPTPDQRVEGGPAAAPNAAAPSSHTSRASPTLEPAGRRASETALPPPQLHTASGPGGDGGGGAFALPPLRTLRRIVTTTPRKEPPAAALTAATAAAAGANPSAVAADPRADFPMRHTLHVLVPDPAGMSSASATVGAQDTLGVHDALTSKPSMAMRTRDSAMSAFAPGAGGGKELRHWRDSAHAIGGVSLGTSGGTSFEASGAIIFGPSSSGRSQALPASSGPLPPFRAVVGLQRASDVTPAPAPASEPGVMLATLSHRDSAMAVERFGTQALRPGLGQGEPARALLATMPKRQLVAEWLSANDELRAAGDGDSPPGFGPERTPQPSPQQQRYRCRQSQRASGEYPALGQQQSGQGGAEGRGQGAGQEDEEEEEDPWGLLSSAAGYEWGPSLDPNLCCSPFTCLSGYGPKGDESPSAGVWPAAAAAAGAGGPFFRPLQQQH